MNIIRALILAVAVIGATPVDAQQKSITCTGTLVDVWLGAKDDWPYAVIYDRGGNYTCLIDRRGSGHEPLKPCVVGEQCRVTGTYSRRLGLGENPTYDVRALGHVSVP